MPVSQHNLSLEIPPLRFLYTKYAPQAVKTPCSSFRPLGTVRSESNCGEGDVRMLFSDLDELSDVERVERFLAMSQDVSKTDMYVERSSNDAPSLPEVPNTGSQLSRCQVFENKYKLVVARATHDYKAQNNTKNNNCKRVIQLPMLKINLETHDSEKEENKALETTRKSLRKIIDVGRNATKPTGIINYQFKTPGQSLKDLSSYASSPMTTVRTGRSTTKRIMFNYEPTRDNYTSRSFINKSDLRLESVVDENSTFNLSKLESMRSNRSKNESARECIDSDDECYSSSDDDKASIMANRLSSAATLGTFRDFTEYQIMENSCESDQSTSEVSSKRKRSTNTYSVSELSCEKSCELPQWPNSDHVVADDYNDADGDSEMQPPPVTSTPNIKEPDCMQHTYFQTPRLPKNILPKGSSVRLPRDIANDFVITNGENGAFPEIKYTLTGSKTKLDPISTPANACSECPVCNLFRHKETTPCPPNTPRTEAERARTTNIQQPFNKKVLSEIDLSTNVDNSNEDSLDSSKEQRYRTSREKSAKDSSSVKKRKAINNASTGGVSSPFRFGYIDSNGNSR